MSEILTYDEIKNRYAPDWVLIGDVVTDEHLEVRTGRVLFHSPVRDEVYAKAIELKPGYCAFRYLGGYPEGMEFLL